MEKNRFLQVRASFWFIPLLYGIIALFLAYGSMALDRYASKHTELYDYIPDLFLSDMQLAQTILSSIATSLLTMTTITFSSILVVLTTYAAQFSPRALQNFTSDRSSQRVLGMFTGGFVYTIVLLLLAKDKGGDLFIVPALAIVVAFACLAAFVFFIHHSVASIKVSNLIFQITSKTMKAWKENYEDDQSLNALSECGEAEEITSGKGRQLKSKKAGYIQHVQIRDMIQTAKKLKITVKVEKALGSYVDEGTPLLTYWGTEDLSDADSLLNQILIIPEQEPIRDVGFGIQKLSEIAIRSISPAFNDPYTTANAVEHIARILTRLGKSYIPKPFYTDEEKKLRVIFHKPSFEDLLYKSFYLIRHHGKEDTAVMHSIISALSIVADNNDKEVKEIIWNFSCYILEGLQETDWISLDKTYLNQQFQRLADACCREEKFMGI
ncbi:DUF2254 domain-containing protein [Metabacillus sp. KIGAM252]|uniref:DUF2254 domain-containing protein n=1 Tax=Metabacillus flavus TaxID=2823519 RepID=A0ABS5LDA3_9BACI|nr:DUF2254 domain-containing protein [Metabacillus flavus]MBS2968573.1 DUF2254 domain-containing protein [Metabacillus flavus]